MNMRLSSSVLLAAAVIAALTPMCWSGSDAVTEDGFELVIPNSGVEEGLPLEISNGHEYCLAMYFINKSEHVLDVSVDVVQSCEEVGFEEKLAGIMLMPEGDPDHGDIFRQPLTVKVDEVCPSYEDARIDVYVFVTDLEDGTKLSYSFTVHVTVYSSYDTSESYNKFFWMFVNPLGPPLDSPVVPFIVTLAVLAAVALLVSLAVAPAAARAIGSYAKGSDTSRLRTVLAIALPAAVIVVAIGPAMGILGADLSVQLPATRISTSAFIAILAFAIWKVYSMAIGGFLARHEGKEDDPSMDLSMLPLFLMLGRLVLWIVATALILSTFGVDLQGVLISAGIITLGITLGAQNVLSQFFSGLVLLTTRPFEAGDILIINGNTLRVKKVKVMFTEFTSRYNDRVITMPNNAVTSATIVNHDKEEKSHYLQVTIPVPYGTDLKKAMEVITKVTDESPYVVHDPGLRPQSIKLIEFQESGMLIELSTNVISFDMSFEIASRLRMAMYEALKDAGIVVPYSRLEVTMLNECFNEDKGQRGGGAGPRSSMPGKVLSPSRRYLVYDPVDQRAVYARIGCQEAVHRIVRVEGLEVDGLPVDLVVVVDDLGVLDRVHHRVDVDVLHRLVLLGPLLDAVVVGDGHHELVAYLLVRRPGEGLQHRAERSRAVLPQLACDADLAFGPVKHLEELPQVILAAEHRGMELVGLDVSGCIQSVAVEVLERLDRLVQVPLVYVQEDQGIDAVLAAEFVDVVCAVVLGGPRGCGAIYQVLLEGSPRELAEVGEDLLARIVVSVARERLQVPVEGVVVLVGPLEGDAQLVTALERDLLADVRVVHPQGYLIRGCVVVEEDRAVRHPVPSMAVHGGQALPVDVQVQVVARIRPQLVELLLLDIQGVVPEAVEPDDAGLQDHGLL